MNQGQNAPRQELGQEARKSVRAIFCSVSTTLASKILSQTCPVPFSGSSHLGLRRVVFCWGTPSAGGADVGGIGGVPELLALSALAGGDLGREEALAAEWKVHAPCVFKRSRLNGRTDSSCILQLAPR